MQARAFPLLLAFSAIAFAQRLEFEVASLKPNNTPIGTIGLNPQRSGDLFRMHNTPLYRMLSYAYDLRGPYQLAGFKQPDGWNWYDIEARIPGGATDAQVRLMMQALMEDRFHLKAHWETREITLYQLVTGKGKSKLRPSTDSPMNITIEDRSFTHPAGRCTTTLWHDGSHVICHAVTIETFTDTVSSLLNAPVAGETGLEGTYDLHIRYVPEGRALDPNIEPGPSLDVALQEELGLKLTKARGPVKVLVIDRLEKPSEN